MKKEKLELLTTLVSEITAENSGGEKASKWNDELLARLSSSLYILYLNARAAEYNFIDLLDSIKGPQKFEGEFITPLSSFWQFTEAILEHAIGHTPSEEQYSDFKNEILESEHDVVVRWFEFHR